MIRSDAQGCKQIASTRSLRLCHETQSNHAKNGVEICDRENAQGMESESDEVIRSHPGALNLHFQ